MNVILEDEFKKENNLKILYIIIIVICIIAVIVVFTAQMIKNNELSLGKNTEIELPQLSDYQINEHKEEFNEIFENKVNYLENNSYKITKIKDNEEIIYRGYQNNESKVNDYELDVNIPYINIRNETIDEFNLQIRDVFEKKAKSILNTQNSNVIYTVDYCAYISNNILSLVVRSTLKEGGNPQRDIVQTYNYDLINQKECTIDDMLKFKGITKKEASQKIKDEIRKVQDKIDELAKLGYTVYSRDYTSDIYSADNVTEYFMGKDNALYIIFAYGNQNHTSEIDMVVM